MKAKPGLAGKKRGRDVFERIHAQRGNIVLPKGETTKDLIDAGWRIKSAVGTVYERTLKKIRHPELVEGSVLLSLNYARSTDGLVVCFHFAYRLR